MLLGFEWFLLVVLVEVLVLVVDLATTVTVRLVVAGTMSEFCNS